MDAWCGLLSCSPSSIAQGYQTFIAGMFALASAYAVWHIEQVRRKDQFKSIEMRRQAIAAMLRLRIMETAQRIFEHRLRVQDYFREILPDSFHRLAIEREISHVSGPIDATVERVWDQITELPTDEMESLSEQVKVLLRCARLLGMARLIIEETAIRDAARRGVTTEEHIKLIYDEVERTLTRLRPDMQDILEQWRF